jgi:hypothetical protein
MNWNEIKKFIRYHIANSKIGVVLSNTKEISEPITKAVDDLSKTIQGKRNDIVNPESISDPIVEAQNATTEAVRGINIPEPITPDMKPLEEQIKSLLDAVQAQDLVVNQGDVNVDLKPVIKAIEKIKLEVPKMEKQEVIDYTLMFDEMMKIMESKEDLKLQELVTKLGTSEDLGVLAEWLKAISLKEYPEFPELKFNKEGRLMIEVDKVGGGGGGGMTSIQETYLKTISDNQSTEAKQDTQIANQDPFAKYKFADLDDDASPNYYGATDVSGNWYILKEDTTAKTLRYATGDSDYPTNWTGRVALSYQYLYEVTIY